MPPAQGIAIYWFKLLARIHLFEQALHYSAFIVGPKLLTAWHLIVGDSVFVFAFWVCSSIVATPPDQCLVFVCGMQIYFCMQIKWLNQHGHHGGGGWRGGASSKSVAVADPEESVVQREGIIIIHVSMAGPVTTWRLFGFGQKKKPTPMPQYSNNWEVFNRVFRFCFSAHSRFRPFVCVCVSFRLTTTTQWAVCSQIIISKYVPDSSRSRIIHPDPLVAANFFLFSHRFGPRTSNWSAKVAGDATLWEALLLCRPLSYYNIIFKFQVLLAATPSSSSLLPTLIQYGCVWRRICIFPEAL